MIQINEHPISKADYGENKKIILKTWKFLFQKPQGQSQPNLAQNFINLIKIRSFDPLPYITTKGSNETPYKG